jgi:hypothetical protein
MPTWAVDPQRLPNKVVQVGQILNVSEGWVWVALEELQSLGA